MAGLLGEGRNLLGRRAVVAHAQIVHAAGDLQVVERPQEVVRVHGVAHAERTGEFDEAVAARPHLDHVAEVGEREHDETRAVRQVLMEGREGVLHRVLAREAAAGHDVAGHGVGDRDVLARLQVAAVLHRAGETRGDVAYGGERVHVGEVGRALREVAFDRVEERVEALVGGEKRRNRERELGVHDRELRIEAGMAAEAAFLLRARVGDDAAAVHFGTGAGGGRDRDDRKGRDGDRLAAALTLLDVVPEVAGIGRHHGHGLRAVHHRAAAEADHEVACFVAGALRGRHHGRDEGIGLDDRHVDVVDARLLKHRGDASERARALHRAAAGREEQRLFAGERLIAQTVEPARTEDQLGGRLKSELHAGLLSEMNISSSAGRTRRPGR